MTMQSQVSAVGTTAAQAADLWARAYAAIQAAGVSPQAPGANIAGTTVEEVNARAVAALAAASRLRDVDDTRADLLAYRLPATKAAVDAIVPQVNAILTALEPLHGATATDRNGHLNFQFQQTEKGAAAYDLGGPLAIVFQQCNALLEQLPYVAQAVGEVTAPVFAGLAQAAGENLGLTRDAAVQAAAELARAKATLAELLTLSSTSAQVGKQIQDLQIAITTQKTAVDANVAEVEQKLARAREISKDGDALQLRVTSFTAQFEAFDTQMKSRLEQFADFERSTKEAQRINGEREASITELIQKADTMIRGATTAGLSKSLDDTKELYESRLRDTQKYFLWSVGGLLICTLPIAAQLVPGPWQHYFTPLAAGDAGQVTPWLAAIGKLILVVPGTWAAAFFASNYAELFHLSREYAHKAALAKAIDGFKREAPEYSQEIVSSVFMEIQENPGSRKAPSPAMPQNPIVERFFQKVLEGIKTARGGK